MKLNETFKNVIENFYMTTSDDIFGVLRREYATVHLFKNYYLMRNNTWATMCPSLWGIVKVEKEKVHVRNSVVGF